MDNNELEIWKKLNECEAAKKAFDSWWLEGDVFLDPSNQQMGRWNWTENGRKLIWIPPLYDPIRPERSLWMIAYNLGLYNLEVIASDFLRPDLALAKAIIEMEEAK